MPEKWLLGLLHFVFGSSDSQKRLTDSRKLNAVFKLKIIYEVKLQYTYETRLLDNFEFFMFFPQTDLFVFSGSVLALCPV